MNSIEEQYDYDIVIIDSGVSLIKNTDLSLSFDFYDMTEDYRFYQTTDYQDDIGHGTAIYHIIARETQNAKIAIFKIFGQTEEVDDQALIRALLFIKEHIRCRLINLSLGLLESDHLEALEEVCRVLSQKNTILVSAFDNQGCMSFPAAFDCVIGVDNWYQCQSVEKYEYVCNSPVTIRAKGGLQKIQWKDRCVVLGGSSFACAHMTAYIFRLISQESRSLSLKEVLEKLKEQASSVYPAYPTDFCSDVPFTIQKAVLFPFNKEMHQLIRFAKDLSFQIVGVYDVAQTGRVGMSTDKIVRKSSIDASNEYKIKNINRLSYDDTEDEFDTLILGHLDEINRVTGRDIRMEIAKKALESGKKVYSFDDIEPSLAKSYAGQFYHPDINGESTAPYFGKLYPIHAPVIGVCGTSSAQGKFTLQMILRKLFLESGYSVGEIGTEPHSLLFGMDYAFPIGYASSLDLNEWQAISVLNRMLFHLSQRDVIIAGSQANTIPRNMNHLSSIPVRMNSFWLGVNPDLVILNINPDDDLDYIRNTIKYIEGLVSCRVVALVLFPMVAVQDWRSSFDIKRPLSEEECNNSMDFIGRQLNLPVYTLGDRVQMQSLYHLLIENLT